MAITPPLPIVGNSEGTWGTTLNQGLTDMDNRLVAAINTNTQQTADITAHNNRLNALETADPFATRPICALTQNVVQAALPHNSQALVLFDTEDTDINGWHDNVNPSRITPNIPGWYRAKATLSFPSRTDWTHINCLIGRKGAIIPPGYRLSTPTGGNQMISTEIIVSCNGTDDYLEAFAVGQNAASATFQLAVSSYLKSTFTVVRERGL